MAGEAQPILFQAEEIRDLFYDKLTKLPRLSLLLGQIVGALRTQGDLGLICVDAVEYAEVDEIYGMPLFDQVRLQVVNAFKEGAKKYSTNFEVIFVFAVDDSKFALVLSSGKKKPINGKQLAKTERRISDFIQEWLGQRFPSSFDKEFGCYVGSEILKAKAHQGYSQAFYEILTQTIESASFKEKRNSERQAGKLERIIEKEATCTVYQPLADLKSQDVIAYEALARGPQRDEFERPDRLFDAARKNNLVLELEQLCRRRAFLNAQGMKKDCLLFINVEKESLADWELRELARTNFLEEVGLGLGRVVLEMSENWANSNIEEFYQILQYFRTIGFRISIDNAGVGYTTLQCIDRIKPDFVKIGMSLVRDISEDERKQRLLKKFVEFTRWRKTRLIAMGIEDFSELKTLLKLGVRLGQGYLLAYPSESFVEIGKERWKED